MRNYFCSANFQREPDFRMGGFYIRPTDSLNFDVKNTKIVGDGFPVPNCADNFQGITTSAVLDG